MHGTGPFENACDTQAVKLRVAVKTVVDLDADNRLTIAMRRQRIELARTPIRTITIAEFAAVNSPLNAHKALPERTLAT
jgi:hypothetical protein